MFSCDKNSIHLMLLLVATDLFTILNIVKMSCFLKFVKACMQQPILSMLIFFTILLVVSMFMANDEWCLYVRKFISRSVPSIYG